MVLAVVGWTATAAATTAYNCNACTEVQYGQTAQSHASTAGAYVHVYDFANNHFRKYNVDREPRLGGGYDYFAIPTIPTAAEQNFFDTARATWVLNGQNANSLKT